MGPLSKLICEDQGYPVTEDGFLKLCNDAMNNDCHGICRECKLVHSSVEPDARENECEGCGKPKVVSLLILTGLI